MAKFYDIHRKAIDQAFYTTSGTGDYFRVATMEPLQAPSRYPPEPENGVCTIITFRRLPRGAYEPAGLVDRQAIADWNQRHKETPSDAWTFPDLSGIAG